MVWSIRESVNKLLRSGDASVSVYTDPFNKRIRIDDYSGTLSEVMKLIRQEIADWVEKVIIKSRTGDVAFFWMPASKKKHR